ncbi:MAG TPA: SpoIIE family protein phosphatase [Sporichthyaceae bacterium]|nr:SpoIIE family protein phosphatase [Sporichthyaceae bacterium]
MSARVLVVDGVDAHREIIGSWLRRAGYQVVEAATGEEALAKVDPDLDVIVLDVDLPDMTGFDVCASVKADPATAGISVMHVSATAIDPHSRAQGLDMGADAYLTEPLDPEELVATVRALARGRAERRAGERLVQQLSRLAAATLPLNAADSLSRLLEAVVTGAAEIFEEPTLAAAELGDGRAIRTICPAPGSRAITEPPGAPLVTAWGHGVTILAEEDQPESWRALLDRADVHPRRWCVVPISDAQHSVRGGICIGLPETVDQPSETQTGLMLQFGEAMRIALENLRAYTEEHRIALTLQRALLPPELPIVAGLTFEARYSAAGERVSVGGDFYDAYELTSGQVVATVGDVQGRSLYAATVMAELRFSLRAYLGELHRPHEALDLLDTLMVRNHPDQTATVALLVFDEDRTALELANAGHLPPLLVTTTGATFLTDSGSLLGLGMVPAHSTRVELPEPCALVLVTDGLIERRGTSIDDSLAAMRDAVLATRSLDPATLADALLDHGGSSHADDDIAVLVVGVEPIGPSGAPG